MNNKDILKHFKQIKDKTIPDDPFMNEAIDGYNRHGILPKDLKAMSRRFKRWPSFTLAVFSGLLVGLTVFLVSQSYAPLKKTMNKSFINKKEELNKTSTTQELPSLKTDHSLVTQPQTKPQLEISHLPEISEDGLYNQPVHLDYLKIEHRPLEIDLASSAKRSNLGRAIYLHDLMVIDYKEQMGEWPPTSNTMLTGLPANLENPKTLSEIKNKEIPYPYEKVLDRALEDFSKSNYKKSLTKLNEILTVIPNDANALFYAALCQFHLQDFEDAENNLLKLNQNLYTNFQESLNFYLCLCYQKNGKTLEFQNLKDQIIIENGFYSQRTKNL